MTDLTILIAVIALALWPIVFLISRILHERNKRAKPSGDTASAETEEVTEEMTTSALIMSILQQLGCQPGVNEENHHSKCHMLFAPEEEEPEKSFTDLLDSFFTTHNTIKENLKQLGNGMPDMEKKERVRIKGFAAYKDNSTELKGE